MSISIMLHSFLCVCVFVRFYPRNSICFSLVSPSIHPWSIGPFLLVLKSNNLSKKKVCYFTETEKGPIALHIEPKSNQNHRNGLRKCGSKTIFFDQLNLSMATDEILLNIMCEALSRYFRFLSPPFLHTFHLSLSLFFVVNGWCCYVVLLYGFATIERAQSVMWKFKRRINNILSGVPIESVMYGMLFFVGAFCFLLPFIQNENKCWFFPSIHTPSPFLVRSPRHRCDAIWFSLWQFMCFSSIWSENDCFSYWEPHYGSVCTAQHLFLSLSFSLSLSLPFTFLPANLLLNLICEHFVPISRTLWFCIK